jgi:hypothetical protein
MWVNAKMIKFFWKEIARTEKQKEI